MKTYNVTLHLTIDTDNLPTELKERLKDCLEYNDEFYSCEVTDCNVKEIKNEI